MDDPTTSKTFKVAEVKPAAKPLVECSVPKALDSMLLPPIRDTVPVRDPGRISREIKRWKANLSNDVNDQFDSFLSSYVSNLIRQSEEVQEKMGVLAHSGTRTTLVANVKYHPFVLALRLAYGDHRPIAISPDMIWLLICQGVANHINANAEALRPKLVDHAGKLELEVVTSHIDTDSPDIDGINWEEVLGRFDQQICQNMGSIAESITADFSTSTSVERNVFRITLMNAMQRFFAYTVTTIICGIPQISLEGDESDWQSMLDRLEAFSDFELDWWLEPLQQVLQQFVAVFRGKIDHEFWRSIYRRFSRGVCTPETAVGWYTVFFPYLNDGRGTPTIRNPWMAGKRDLKTLLYPPDKLPPLAPDSWLAFFRELARDEEYRGFFDSELPLGTSVAPFIWNTKNLFGSIIDSQEMEFVSGFTGISQNRDSLCLRPEIGWAVYKKSGSN